MMYQERQLYQAYRMIDDRRTDDMGRPVGVRAESVYTFVLNLRSGPFDEDVYPILDTLCEFHADAIMTLVPRLQIKLLSASDPVPILSLLKRIVSSGQHTRERAKKDLCLWRNLATVMHEDAMQNVELVIELVDITGGHGSWCHEPVLSRACDIVFGSRVATDATLGYIAACAKHPHWNDKIASALLPVLPCVDEEWGVILKNILDAPSVMMLVYLEATEQLAAFERRILKIMIPLGKEGVAVWSHVHKLLVYKWPTRFSVALQPGTLPTKYECPITLQPCMDPVVASDGITYERDAIVRCMVTRGFVSPSTRQIIDARLIPNRALERITPSDI